MMRWALLALTLAACSPPQPAPDVLADVPDCSTVEMSGQLLPVQCQLQVGEHTLNVNYLALAEGAVAGTVSVDVLSADGAMAQSMLEPEVPEYRAPSVQDIDGDGRADIIMRRATGNVNSEMGLWVFNGERGLFDRVGDASGVSIERTENGLIAVPARSSAVEWSVALYRLDEGGLHGVATVTATAPVGRSTEPGCRLTARPETRDTDISEISAMQAAFFAEPVVTGVFQ